MSTAASQPRFEKNRLIVVMGVAGSGKSTIGTELTELLAGTFLEGDSFHPEANIEKMSAGIALTDEDRWPWLDRFGRELAVRDGTIVGACSALRRAYRERITARAGEPVLFVHLKGDRELIARRMAARAGHFMPASLLDSQFRTLEQPDPDENAIVVGIAASSSEICRQICKQLGEME